MCLSATMRSPLRSKRAMISPVRPRANASGLTRIRVRSIGVSLGSGSARWRLCRGRLLGHAAAPAARGLPGDLRLAVGADLPLGIQRLAADLAGVLELAQAVRAAQEGLLDLVLAV